MEKKTKEITKAFFFLKKKNNVNDESEKKTH
jgi:hypothetical protein